MRVPRLWRIVGAFLLLAACSSSATPTTKSSTTTEAASTTSAATSTSSSTSSTSTTAVSGDLPRFEPGTCITMDMVNLANSSRYDIECGNVIVPEDRSDPNGRTVSLPVVVARTLNPDPRPDPLIYLAGGGGHAHLTYAYYMMEWVGNAVLENRDFIQYNQRGAPDTEPELACPGYTEFLFDLAARPEIGSIWSQEHIDYLASCDQQLMERGIDLSMYNSATNAEDARDVRIALGYEEANYYGTSYGTRLGLDLIRDHPEGVRSIILDSVYPPEVGYYSEYATFAHSAFEAVFAGCAGDTACSVRYPNLESDFWATVDRLNEQPARVNSPFGPVSVDGGVFMDSIAIHLYSPDWIPRAPAAIDSVADGDLTAIAPVIVGAVTAPDISFSMFYAMQCREEVPFESFDEATANSAGLPPQIDAHYTQTFARFHFDMCDNSVSGTADPIEAEAVVSPIPALVLAGSYDPATPSYWSRQTAETLGNAYYAEFPTLGHGVMRSNECGLNLGLAFLDDPSSAPDMGCINQQPPVAFRVDG